MAKGGIGSTVAAHDALLRLDDWQLVDQLNGPVRVDHLGSVHETGISIVVRFVELK